MIGLAVIGAVIAYLAWVRRMRRQEATVLGVKPPGLRLTLGQMALGVIDICSASAALYVLLPHDNRFGFPAFATLYSFASVLGIASHAPGGLGVFEATILQGVGGSRTPSWPRSSSFASSITPSPSHRDGDAWRRRGGAPLAFAARSDVEPVRRLARWAMKSLEARKLAELVESPFAAKLIGAMPEPAVIVSADERAAAANKPALDLLPGLRIGDPFVLGLRAPDVIDARRRVMASGEAETVQWSERVPVERLFEVTVAPLATSNGEVVATLITLRDQTEARRVERLASTSSPTPVTSCAPRWLPCSASSRPCKARRTMTRRRATASSPSCVNRGGAWPG